MVRKNNFIKQQENKKNQIEKKKLAQTPQTNPQWAESVNAKIYQLQQDLGNAYDLINMLIYTKRVFAPTANKFFTFCQDKLGVSFVEMDNDVKINSLIQYFESCFNIGDAAYKEIISNQFDHRNGLRKIVDDEVVQQNDYVTISWRFETDGKIIAQQNGESLYQIGLGDLLVDDQIKEMKAGESKVFAVKFPDNYKVDILKGKSGNLYITVFNFKTRRALEMSEEKKKQVWDEHFQSQKID